MFFVYRGTYKVLDTMGGLVLLIFIAIAVTLYLLQAYLIWLMIILTVLAALRIFLWFHVRRW